jgi:4-alpha-glucanotransferase
MTSRRRLEELARRCGMLTEYTDQWGRLRRASEDAIRGVLGALGHSATTDKDVEDRLRELDASEARRVVDPVLVQWEGEPTPQVDVTLPRADGRQEANFTVLLESGGRRTTRLELDQVPTAAAKAVAGARYIRKRFPLPPDLPRGVHRVRLHAGATKATAHLIVAPLEAWRPRPFDPCWLAFLPLHALRTHRDWGAGDWTDLAAFLEWATRRGAAGTALLPVYAAHDAPSPSPYAPTSRTFFHELYVDPTSAPEFAATPEARRLHAGAAFQAEVAAQRAAPLVDAARIIALKRRLLEPMSRRMAGADARRQAQFDEWLRRRPDARAYARFQAVARSRGPDWTAWPTALREADLGSADVDETEVQYHLYVQFLLHEQFTTVSARARERGPGFYLDLPIGVHPHGFDAWRDRDLYASEASVGAPPDAFFTRGQDWGFPPPHPDRWRAAGYVNLRRDLDAILPHAGVLRIDHALGLHRLYWIPRGRPANDGAYVRYHAEELYALLSLYSHRHRTLLVGEDLGTVPPEVPHAMRRHGFLRSWVLPFEIDPHLRRALRDPDAGAAAYLNTHDTATFHAWWHGRDIDHRAAAGLIDAPQARAERRRRTAAVEALADRLRAEGLLDGRPKDPGPALQALLTLLARSDTALLVINVEDLWAELEPQNDPARPEGPNFRRRAHHPLETWDAQGAVRALVNRLARRTSRRVAPP